MLLAWSEFVKGKRSKQDVQVFSRALIDNIDVLHWELASGLYRHGGYQHFVIHDPKRRDIHKASVRDRLVHHCVHRMLYPYFDRRFIADSFSCRTDKGTHRAMDRFRSMANKVSHNHTRTCWVLKMDIRKFFASINQNTLLRQLDGFIVDTRIVYLLREIIFSFHTVPGFGLPLGNLTSQLFVNVYMNEFDQFVKHALGIKFYIRYADDFVILSRDREHLNELIPEIDAFLFERLLLQLHPDKTFIKTLASGVDFLGWVHFPDHRVLRRSSRHRMFRKLRGDPREEVYQSYRGLLAHGNGGKLQRKLLDDYWMLS